MEFIAIDPSSSPDTLVAPAQNEVTSVLPMVREMYRKTGFVPPWICYLARENDVVVGSCGFKAPPKDGRVELAYFTFPAHEGKGVATRMAQHLLKLAERADPSVIVIGQTLSEENASTRILRKLSFSLVGEVMHPQDGRVWEWHRAPHPNDR